MSKKYVIVSTILFLAPIIPGIFIGYFSTIPTVQLIAAVMLGQTAILLAAVICWIITINRDR